MTDDALSFTLKTAEVACLAAIETAKSTHRVTTDVLIDEQRATTTTRQRRKEITDLLIAAARERDGAIQDARNAWDAASRAASDAWFAANCATE